MSKKESGTSQADLGCRQSADNCAVTMLDDGWSGRTGFLQFD